LLNPLINSSKAFLPCQGIDPCAFFPLKVIFKCKTPLASVSKLKFDPLSGIIKTFPKNFNLLIT
jgi:hypothetical protein